jgi:hypothetical protein
MFNVSIDRSEMSARFQKLPSFTRDSLAVSDGYIEMGEKAMLPIVKMLWQVSHNESS